MRFSGANTKGSCGTTPVLTVAAANVGYAERCEPAHENTPKSPLAVVPSLVGMALVGQKRPVSIGLVYSDLGFPLQHFAGGAN